MTQGRAAARSILARLFSRSVANFDNVHVVVKARLLSRIGALKPRRIDEVKRALGFSLDWPELKEL